MPRGIYERKPDGGVAANRFRRLASTSSWYKAQRYQMAVEDFSRESRLQKDLRSVEAMQAIWNKAKPK